ncbi:MAG: Xaa-Pro peptidase family protein [Bryobacteraceae bacterium]
MTESDQRCQAVSARLRESKVDALLIASPANVRYLSGFDGSNGLILLTAKDTHFFTDPRYAIAATRGVSGKVHVAKGPLYIEASKVIRRKRLKKVGFEAAQTNFQAYQKLKEVLPLGASLVPVGGVIENLRMVKSAAEIEKIRASVQVNSAAYEKVLQRVRPGVREADIAAELEYQMKLLGAEKPSFDTIVAAGERTALPHAHPTGYRLVGNELLLVDMGACLDGYASDMTRVVHLGTPPRRVKQMYAAVLESQLAAIDAVRPGATAGSVDRAARQVLKRHGLDKFFVHSTGHGLGLEIHEPPRLGRTDETILQPGMAVTIEPGAYIEGKGGIRIEDTVLVNETGCEILTPTPKEFLTI